MRCGGLDAMILIPFLFFGFWTVLLLIFPRSLQAFYGRLAGWFPTVARLDPFRWYMRQERFVWVLRFSGVLTLLVWLALWVAVICHCLVHVELADRNKVHGPRMGRDDQYGLM